MNVAYVFTYTVDLLVDLGDILPEIMSSLELKPLS